MVVTFLTFLSVSEKSLLSRRVQNVTETSYTCLLLNCVAVISATQTESVKQRVKLYTLPGQAWTTDYIVTIRPH